MHSDFTVFDAHCDSLTETKGDFGKYKGEFSVSDAGMYKNFIQVAAIWIDRAQHTPWQRACEYIETAHRSTGINIIKTPCDFDRQGVGIILGIEGGEAIGEDLAKLSRLYEMGIRVFGLTWNTPGYISGTAMGGGGGLTPFGRQVVSLAEKLGMVIDVSHISEEGFYHVAEQMKTPFIASHSNLRAICDHPRNLSDDQFKTLVRAGGVAGVNYHTDFIGRYVGVDGILAHIERFMELGGEENVGLGSDFDGGINKPEGINGVKDHYTVLDALLRRGYTEKQVQNIAVNNFKRVFLKILSENGCNLGRNILK